jgi:hypothetical protein
MTDTSDTLAQWEDWLQQQFGGEIARLKSMFEEHRYGCWCGPGNRCNEIEDDIDSCCHQHDQAYGAVGVTSEDPPPSGYVSMWTADGFKRTKSADAALVACVTATAFDSHFYGPSAAVYRAGVDVLFGGRAAIAAALEAAGF